MKKLSINSIVLVLSAVSFTWILFYKIYFLEKDSIFPRAYELGELTYTLLSAVVASGIFYFFVVFLDYKKTSKVIDPIIVNRLKAFEHSNFFIKKGIYEFKDLEVPPELPSMEEFKKVCEGIDLNQAGPVIQSNPMVRSKNWYEFFQYYLGSDFYNSQLLISYTKYLPVTIVGHLDTLQFSTFQSALNTYKASTTYHKLSGISNPLWTYLKTSEELCKIGKQMRK